MGRWAIAVYGGTGVDPNLPAERKKAAKQLLLCCLNLAISALRSNCPTINIVELVVRKLETDPLFNSGHGFALTEHETVEIEASIMDGPKRHCGAVSRLTTVKKSSFPCPTRHGEISSFISALSGTEEFTRQQGVELVDNEYFITEENVGMLKLAKEANSILFDYRIPNGGCTVAIESPFQMNGFLISVYVPKMVGCIVVDKEGRCTSATSTGGLMNKRAGSGRWMPPALPKSKNPVQVSEKREKNQKWLQDPLF